MLRMRSVARLATIDELNAFAPSECMRCSVDIPQEALSAVLQLNAPSVR